MLLPRDVPEFMRVPLMVHVGAGMVGIVTGYVALGVTKGAVLHRRVGLAFVYAMVTMGLVGSVVAATEPKVGSVIAGLTAAYFVVSALLAVRPRTDAVRRLERAGLLVAAFVATMDFTGGALLIADGRWSKDGVPVPMMIFMATVLTLAAFGDYRSVRADGLRGTPRIVRHLWRMCFSLFIAAGSFFLGQARVIPAPLRVWPVLFALSLLPLVAMGYWAWRLKVRRQLRGLVVGALERRPPDDDRHVVAGASLEHEVQEVAAQLLG